MILSMARRWSRTIFLFVGAWISWPGIGQAEEHDLAGPHECALMSEDFRPCTLSTRAVGGYTVSQPGGESFQGSLTPQGTGFFLDGIYKYPSAPDAHLMGTVTLTGTAFEGRVKADKIPVTISIRPAKAPKPPAKPSELSTAMTRMVDRDAVVSSTKLPLTVHVDDAPKQSFMIKVIDDPSWEKIKGIFGMVPPANNIGIECTKAKLACTLTAQSGASVIFHFVKTPDGPKLKRVDLPAEGD